MNRADQQFEEGTATARAPAQSQKDNNAQAGKCGPGKKGPISRDCWSSKNQQSGRQAEDIQKEEERANASQRLRNVWQVMRQLVQMQEIILLIPE
ncbi:MAG: hypothetical protein ACLS36_01330 [Streptococcus sp.]